MSHQEKIHDILVRCQRGEESGWREIFALTYPLSKWVGAHTIFYASSSIVDEIAQEMMIVLAENIGKINDETHLKRFVKRVTRNKCIDYIRRNREQFADIPDDIPMEEDAFLENHIVEVLHEAVRDLREPCKTMIRSRYLQNHSYKEISQKVGIDIGQIGVRLSRCLAFLKDLLAYRHVSWEDIQ